MEKRIKLFTSYCLPSILNQTNQNFKWLIYFDSQTSGEYMIFFNDLMQKFPKLVVRYIDNSEQLFAGGLYSDISQLLDTDCRFVLTTRLDNDDAIHKNTVDTIQKKTLIVAESQPKHMSKFLINLSKGYCLRVEPHYELTCYTHLSNPFITMIEQVFDKREFNTVLQHWHDYYLSQTQYPVIQVNDTPYWLQIIHSNNVSNDMKGLPLLDRNKLSEFGIDISKIFLPKRYYIKNIIRRCWSPVIRRFAKISTKNRDALI